MKKPTTEELETQKYTEEELEKWASQFDKDDWGYVSCFHCERLSDSFMGKFADKLDLEEMSTKIQFSESFMEKYGDKIHWGNISHFQKLSDDFIEKHQDKLNWADLSWNICETLSESIIEKYKDRLEWEGVYDRHRLSEDFMRKYKNISIHQLHSIARLQRFSPAFAVEMEMYDELGEIEENIFMSDEEKKGIIETLTIVNKLSG